MKKKIIALSLLVAGLYSCSNNEELIKENPGYMEKGYAGLTIRMNFPSAQTRAVGDTLTGASSVSFAEEREINSVAFFVKTNEETVGSEVKTGAFNKYFSTDEPLSANGLNEPLAKVGEGNYTAQIKIKSEGWGGNTKVIVIANYAENGLTDRLKAVVEWDDLAKFRTDPFRSSPTTPLLMYGMKEVQMVSGETKGVEFMMERMVARVDILNNAFDADASKGFVLTSAQLLCTNMCTYLLPQNEGTKNIPTATEGFALRTPDAATPLQIDSIYTYETPNYDTNLPAVILVKGTFRGVRVSKEINFRHVNSLGALTDTIGLARNRRYLVNINPTPDSTAIDWTVKVAEWEVADTIRIQPSMKVPAIESLAMTGGAAGDWDAATKTYTVPDDYAGGTKITFTASAAQSPEFRLGYNYITSGASFGFADDDAFKAAAVKEGDPVITYAARITREYEVTVPSQSKYKVPADVYIRIINSANDEACDTIKIVYRPNYAGTAFQPVLMKSGQFWAPINVGATEMPTSVSKAENTDVTAGCGLLFQWGRKHGFAATNNVAICAADTANVATLGWPVQSNFADVDNSGSAWLNKFIIAGDKTKHGVNTLLNWLRINPAGDDPGDRDMVADAWYQKLWDAKAVAGVENVQAAVEKTVADPCPDGWRVPRIVEWKAIGAGNTGIVKEWDATNKLLKIAGAISGEALVLPAAGKRYASDGESGNQGINGYYWASSVPVGTVFASFVCFQNNAALISSVSGRADGHTVRCVQE